MALKIWLTSWQGQKFRWHLILPDPARPLHRARRPDPPVACIVGFWFDKFLFLGSQLCLHLVLPKPAPPRCWAPRTTLPVLCPGFPGHACMKPVYTCRIQNPDIPSGGIGRVGGWRRRPVGGSNSDALLIAPDQLFRVFGSIEVRPGSLFKSTNVLNPM